MMASLMTCEVWLLHEPVWVHRRVVGRLGSWGSTGSAGRWREQQQCRAADEQLETALDRWVHAGGVPRSAGSLVQN